MRHKPDATSEGVNSNNLRTRTNIDTQTMVRKALTFTLSIE